MDLKLVRKQFIIDGIFSQLLQADGSLVAHTLEYAYEDSFGNYNPKLPPGVYTCVRGKHKLHSTPNPFDTFEIMNVPNCTGILFHWGNYNHDSDGCVLLGENISTLYGHAQMIVNSKFSFHEFMELQKGVDKFTLTVI